jgi:hypothetical protein
MKEGKGMGPEAAMAAASRAARGEGSDMLIG